MTIISKEHDDLLRVQRNDPTVARCMDAGLSHTRIITILATEKERLFKRIIELEAIAPKKTRMPDGTMMIWHCPDNLVPDPKA